LPTAQADLFATRLPRGTIYEPDFLTIGEECGLLGVIRTLPLNEARRRQYTARRRTLNYGSICILESSG
jgi:hypothetical protein